MQREEGKEAVRPPVRDDANADAEGTAAQTVFGRSDISSNDVMLGRGSRSIGNPGNVAFRQIVRQRKEEYCATTNRKTKATIARQVMNVVYSRKGRFVRKVSPESEEDAWIVVADEDSILTKVKQSLRDKDPGSVGLFPARLGSQSLQQQAGAQSAARPGSLSPVQQQQRNEAKRTPLKKRRHGESQFVDNPVSASQRPTGATSMDTTSSTTDPFNVALLHAALSGGRPHDVGLTPTGLVSSSSAPLSQNDVRMQHLCREHLGNSAVPSLPRAPASLLAALIQKQQQQDLTANIVGPPAADPHGRLSSHLSQQLQQAIDQQQYQQQLLLLARKMQQQQATLEAAILCERQRLALTAMQRPNSAAAHQLPPLPELASLLSPAELQALASSNDRNSFSPSAVVPGRSSSQTNIDADLLASILLQEQQQQLQLQAQQLEQRQPTATIGGLLRHPSHQQQQASQQHPLESMLRGQPGSHAGQPPLQHGGEANQQFSLPQLNDLWTLQALAQRRPQQQLDSQKISQPVELAALRRSDQAAAAMLNSTDSSSPEDQKPRARDD